MDTHGPENAEHELRIAYSCVIDAGMIHFWDQQSIPAVHPDEAFNLYRHAFKRHREGKALAAERWARAVKHLARALRHEAKIAYLETHADELPVLRNATDEELGVQHHSDTTTDLIDSLEEDIPPGMTEMPNEMKRYLSLARKHLEFLKRPDYTHEVLRAEHLKAAWEYGRTVECIALAYEAENPVSPDKAA